MKGISPFPRDESFSLWGQMPMSKISLVMATHNEGKSREYALLLKDLPVQIHRLSEFDNLPELKEVGRKLQSERLNKQQGCWELLRLPMTPVLRWRP